MKTELSNPLNDTEKVRQIIDWMLEGKSDFQVSALINEQFPLDNPGPLIQAAVGEFIRDAEQDPVIVAGWCFRATQYLYKQFIEDGDYAGALRAVKQMADLSRKSSVHHVWSNEADDDSDADEAGPGTTN